MNQYFLPNKIESSLIQQIQKYCRNDFSIIRMTPTMLKKHIIDASEEIRVIFRDNGLVDYKKIKKGDKIYCHSVIISAQEIYKNNTSLYRPTTKNGDPRFWVKKLKKFVSSGDLVYFTIHDSTLVVIPLIEHQQFTDAITAYFGVNDKEQKIVERFYNRIRAIKEQGWVLSVSPEKHNDKDIGETLERELGISINNLKTPDYEGTIEVKGKNIGSKTKDSLFNMVPDWKNSKIRSVKEMALTFGYPDNEYPGYKALFVTVNNKPNKQGLFIEVDEENQLIRQKCLMNGIVTDVCTWKFDVVKKRLYKKHPKTMWIVADNEVRNGKVYFKYLKVQFTQRPIFSQFILLLKQGIITFDWRRRANTGIGMKLPSSKTDYGQGFRIAPSKRHLLFGETKDLHL